MVMLRVDESEVFESAWFVLRRERAAIGEEDMLAEANRIIGISARQQKKPRKKWGVCLFLLGFCCGVIFFAVVARFLLG
jgi:hypothetical protein